MAVRRSFAVEDKNLSTTSVIVAKKERNYSDIDLTLDTKPSGDIYKKTDAASVKQSIKNILLTSHGEKPFDYFFGANIRDRLFDLNYPDLANELETDIRFAIENHEPRARVMAVDVINNIDHNDLRATIKFQIISTEEVVVLNTSLTRIK